MSSSFSQAGEGPHAPLPEPTAAFPPADLADQICALQVEDWRQGRRTPAEEYLNRHSLLGQHPEEAFAVVWNEFALRESLGEPPPREEFLRRFPTFAERLRRQWELHDVLGESPSACPDTPVPNRVANAKASAQTPLLPGYEILGELGRGGMGVVYKARQVGLQRLVAVKTILHGPHVAASMLARFRREAEIIAQLLHPNIVQIYEIGELQGVPYFTMEYVAGGSLHQWLQHQPHPPREAAAFIAKLAAAIHATHQRGIVHRDLKPANILLAAAADPAAAPTARSLTSLNWTLTTAQPKITDFGLAKLVEGATDLTSTGLIVGTPSYMAPEQARGPHEGVGPAADIYALGAILYEMLTGRPPFLGQTPMDTVMMILGEEVLPPRRLQPKVPTDLETICLKTMHREPHGRYASAQALVDDLDRFLADKPIQARPVGQLERARRWCRRNPLAATLLSGLILAFFGLAATAGLLVLTNAQEREARLLAEAQRQRADGNYQLARDAVDQTVLRIAADPQLRIAADFHPLRRHLLESMLPFYRELLAQDSQDPGTQMSQARAAMQLADVWRFMGELDKAQAGYDQAEVLYRTLTTRFPARAHLRLEWGRVLRCRSQVHLQRGQEQAAADDQKEAFHLLLPLVERDPQRVAYLAALIQLHHAVAQRHCQRDAWAEALAEYERSVKLSEKLVLIQPTHFTLLTLATSLNSWGESLRRAQRSAEAEQPFIRAMALLTQLSTDKPRDLETREHLAAAHNNLGSLYLQLQRPREALPSLRRAADLSAQLAAEFPSVLEFAVDVGEAYCNYAKLLSSTDQAEEALAWYAKAAEKLGAVLVREPNRSEARRHLSRVHQQRAAALADLKRYVEAAAAWEQAIPLEDERLWPQLRMKQALALAHAGDAAKAVAQAEELLGPPSTSKADPELAYDAARVLALASRQPGVAPAQAAAWADLALARLQQLHRDDYFQDSERRERLRTEEAFAPWRSRPEFERLLTEPE